MNSLGTLRCETRARRTVASRDLGWLLTSPEETVWVSKTPEEANPVVTDLPRIYGVTIIILVALAIIVWILLQPVFSD